MIESLSDQLLDQIADRVSERLLAETRRPQTEISHLRSRYEAFNKRHEFKPGQLVCWKPGLRNRTSPNYGEAGIVIEVLAEPIYDSNLESGSSYFREPLDMVIAVISDSDFMIFYYDKRRFEPMQEI